MKEKNELKKKEKVEPTSTEVISGMVEMVSGDEKVSGEELLKYLRKNKSGKLKDIPEKIILPMIDQLQEMKHTMEENIAVSYALGMFLQDEPFIPEYLGFKESVMDVDGFKIRSYRKDNMVVMRNYFEKIETGTDKWVITKNVGDESLEESISVHLFESMLEAVITLKSLGSGVSIMDAVASKYVS